MSTRPSPNPSRSSRRRRLRGAAVPIAALTILGLAACGSDSGDGGAGSTGGDAGAYPDGPITFVVPFSAGGPTDTVTRLIAEPMSKELGAQIVVQNVEGAGGTLAAGEVADAEPDGQKVLMYHIGMATSPSLYPDLPYKPLESFKTIGVVTTVPMTIIAKKDFPPNSFTEMVDYVKANQDKVNLAHAGKGAASHLCGLLMQKSFGVKLNEVAYKGTGPALTDLVGDQTTNTTEQIKAGKVKAYAATTPERVGSLPDLETTVEAGMPDLQVGVWHGLYVPAETPDAVVSKLSDALKVALKDETVKSKMADLGTAPAPEADATPDALTKLLTEQIALWEPILKSAG